MKDDFIHIGMTVSSLERTLEFYHRYFGFEQLGEIGVFSEDFIAAHNALYHQKAGTYARFCFMRSRDGVVFELFEFHPLAAPDTVWNRPGLHHICLKTEHMQQTYEKMQADGVHFFFPPDMRAVPTEHWVFLEDPDGNLIELQD